MRLAGHTLIGEGAAHDVRGQRIRGQFGGSGSAKCSCGKLSGILHSDRARKKWHGTHKDENREQVAA